VIDVRRAALVVSSVALLLAPVGASSQRPDAIATMEQQQQALFAEIAPAVVYIARGPNIGSGFFVNASGLVLTNAHVVGKKTEVEVILHDGRKTTGKLVEMAEDDIDLALIQTPLAGTPFLELGGVEALRVGSWVAAVGHGRGCAWTYLTGMVTNIYSDGAERPVFQTQIPINPGFSGGPIVDRDRKVVGIVVAGITDSNSINFAIRSDKAVQVLAKLRGNYRALTIHAPKGVPIFVDGALAGVGPTVVSRVPEGNHEVFAVICGKMVTQTVEFPKIADLRLPAPESCE